MAVNRVHQRQIVYLNYRFIDVDEPLPHPALVVSTDEIQEEEGGFYAVLISSKNIHPQYTLEIKDSDLIGSDRLDKKSFYVTHMMSFFPYDDVISNFNLFVNKNRFNTVVNKVIDSIFGPEE